MPLYEYECDACGERFEKIQKFSDPAPDACAKCGKGPVRRLMSSPAIQFKGSGFYITDYAQKGRSEGGPSGSKGKSDAGKSDSAGESKSEGAAAKEGSAKSDAPATPSSSTTTSTDKKD